MKRTPLLLFPFLMVSMVRAGDDSPTQDAASDTITHYEQLALVNNPTLRQADALVKGELAKATQAGLYPNPAIGYVGEQIGAPSETSRESAGEFQGGFVRQEIVLPAKLDLSKKKYLMRAEIAALGKEAQVLSVRNDVRIQAYRVLGRREHLAVERELLESLRDGMLTAKELFNVGQGNEVDLAMARIALTEQKLAVQMAENELTSAWRDLEAVVGVPLPDHKLQDSLIGTVPERKWDTVLKNLLLNSPEVRAADVKLRADEITVRRERVEPIPNLVLEGAYGHNFEVDENVWNVSASVEVPIFDWNQGTIRQAKADRSRQQSEIQRVQRMLMLRLSRVYRQFETLRQHVLGYRENVLPEAKKAFEISLKSYHANRLAWPPVLHAQRFYHEKRLLYIDQWVALREAQTLLDGYLLNSGLMAPSGPVPAGHIDANPKPR